MTEFKSALIDLPENDDSVTCPECDDGTDRDGRECIYCDGIGVVSEREYKEQIRVEQEDFDCNN